MELLKLAALDAEDLTVISAHLQDAILRPDDLSYLVREKRFALALRRFDWSAGLKVPPRRRLTGLHFERVLSVRTRGLRRGDDAVPLSLLAITFTPGDTPSGQIEILFSGNGTIRLEVECIEARMKDLGPVWEAGARPGHGDTPEPEA
ncbi:DUF2948 family protein [Methylobacterium persicinum]|uniref:DUF2948 domain-containing protein n=1 Tax=Methylobacterium persicinum TaxID=374426 RepID=A0ABU0HII3_9HYPH|nr:DUF2948 family protein [Methylobacterium persicinum]MDQ0441628.1 hypothetical protein [Methylobacterium persicinum]GJE39390.1 hypothetical protein KHHGKMAE_3472 [Methylobacterium persicinum]